MAGSTPDAPQFVIPDGFPAESFEEAFRHMAGRASTEAQLCFGNPTAKIYYEIANHLQELATWARRQED